MLMDSNVTMWNWNCIVQVFGMVLVTATAQQRNVKTSKACYDGPGRPCAEHKCNCNTDTIALIEAYYTNNTECTQNENENCYNYTEQKGKYELTQANLTSLYNTCSFKSKCSFGPIRKGSQINFSVIKYECIEDKDILDMCSVSSHNGTQFTIAANASSSRKCQCKIEHEKPESMPTIRVNALQIQLGKSGTCSRLEMKTNVKKIEQNCSSIHIQNRTLVETTSPVHIELTNVQGPEHAFVWLQVLGSRRLVIRCFADQNVGSTTAFPSTDKVPSETDRTPSSNVNIAVAAGGAAAAVVVVAVLITVILLIRRCRKPANNDDNNIPVSQVHPTYSGLFKTKTGVDNRV